MKEVTPVVKEIDENRCCGGTNGVSSVVKQVIAVMGDKMSPGQLDSQPQNSPESQEPLCDDILSCISALDDVIAEFDDSISQSSSSNHIFGGIEETALTGPVISGPSLNPIPSCPIPRVTCSVNPLPPPEPVVTILQSHSQTVTEIQIGSSIPAPSQNPSQQIKMASSKIKSPSKLNEPLLLKQSHFSPVKVTKPVVEAPTQVLEISGESKSPNGNYTSYGIIFPKTTSAISGGDSSPTAPVVGAGSVIPSGPPAPFPRVRRAGAKVTQANLNMESGGGGSFPLKVKEPIYEVIAESSSSQSVKVRASPKPGAYKGMPLFISETTPAEELAKEQRRAQLLQTKTEQWNFPSDDKLPRSLRKTRKTCIEEDEDEGGAGKAGKTAVVVIPKSASSSAVMKSSTEPAVVAMNGGPVKNGERTHAVQVRVVMSKKGEEVDKEDNGKMMKTSTTRGLELLRPAW